MPLLDPHELNTLDSMVRAVRSQDYIIDDVERAHSRIDTLAEVVARMLQAMAKE